ncbi:RHS repeat domain-containing protein [Tenacibaculum sp. MEBiC06402]|uniref:RHS repeat domain-containing protein n=1 Tax=unclassified Tenacibaculum TaxID=2635139 RepID=UPI003B9D952F
MRIKKYILMLIVLGQTQISLTQNTEKKVTDSDKNWVSVNAFDITGKVIAANVQFFDNMARLNQTQSFDTKTGKNWASVILYDRHGRSAIQTLSAPISFNTDFTYKNDFIKKTNNSIFGIADFENSDINNPSVVGSQANTLGWYYSENNTSEPFQDVTNRPYSRTIYSELTPGGILRAIGGNKIDEEWKQGYVFSMPAGQELSQNTAFNNPEYSNIKVSKTISRDAHGIENVVFTDTDGHTLASARSGNEEEEQEIRYSTVLINEQDFVDIHIPVGTRGIEVKNDVNQIMSRESFDIYDLITEKKVTTSFSSLGPGVYRIDYKGDNWIPIHVKYPENYYNFSLNEYDETGRVIATYQPLQKLKSEFEYNSLGQLIYSKSPDEGEAWFKYRKDGQIRYSQNSKQRTNNQMSYTNYDNLGRPIESGVYTGFKPINFDTLDPDGYNFPGSTSEVHKTTYDYLESTEVNILPNGYKKPQFLSGNVSKTWNNQTTTYYSYDIYGRVKWIVQNIPGLGIKTIDYEYDPITSQVNIVVFQKGKSDQFIHRYTYDESNYNLVKVETSTDGRIYKEHASYNYYETGALKRLNLARGLQGVDYVYNLNGALKSINHPNLNDSNDPGNDRNDLFGMNLHYYNGDYHRKNTPTPVPDISGGIEQYNGNIKAITWNTKRPDFSAVKNSYYYSYNKNNWLTGASFNQPITADVNFNSLEIRDDLTAESEDVKATKTILFKPGFELKATASLELSGKIVENIEGGVDGKGDYNVYNITYDENGNIQSLHRNKNKDGGSNEMDKLSYYYKKDKPNQLVQVKDFAGNVNGANDIGSQNDLNYIYNEIGQLIENKSENLKYVYNSSGLVSEVIKNGLPLVKFYYNDKNHRVKKESYNTRSGSLGYTEHYVRDAAGTAMAIYRNRQLVENTIYGSGRLGVYKSDGTSLYQLTDHLGNVRAVIGRGANDQPMALTAATDYYPFGMPMPNRDLKGDYRYAYQGQEKDTETGMEAFELRLWDSRIGRWLTTDPYGQYNSPYLGMGNNPINGVDSDGGLFLWKPKLNNDGSTSYIAESGDTAQSFADQYGVTLKQAQELIGTDNIIAGETSVSGQDVFNMFGSSVLKLQRGGNTTKQQEWDQLVYAFDHSKSRGAFAINVKDYFNHSGAFSGRVNFEIEGVNHSLYMDIDVGRPATFDGSGDFLLENQFYFSKLTSGTTYKGDQANIHVRLFHPKSREYSGQDGRIFTRRKSVNPIDYRLEQTFPLYNYIRIQTFKN